MRTRLALALGFFLMLPAAAALADGQSPDPAAEAREHARRGAELFREKDHRGALGEYRRAFQLSPNYRVQYNIGLICLELRDWACAYTAFQEYLRDGGKEVPAERQRSVSDDVEMLRRRVAHVKVVVDRAGADVAVDDVGVGQAPLASDLIVAAGRHRVTVSAPDTLAVSKVIDVVGGDSVTVKIDLRSPVPTSPTTTATPTPPPTPSKPPQETTPPARDTPPARPSRVPLIVVASVTGAAAIGGAVTGILALGARTDLRNKTGQFGATTGDIDSARSKASTLATVTDVLFASAIVGGAVSAVLFFTTRPRSPSEPSVSVTPAAAAGGGGMVVSGKF